MKTRQGFVSNSSSSSFCILGVEIERDICDKVEAAREQLKGTGVETNYAISGGEWVCVGINVTTMKDDETPLQVKQRLVSALDKIGVSVDIAKVGFIEDGGYNG